MTVVKITDPGSVRGEFIGHSDTHGPAIQIAMGFVRQWGAARIVFDDGYPISVERCVEPTKQIKTQTVKRPRLKAKRAHDLSLNEREDIARATLKADDLAQQYGTTVGVVQTIQRKHNVRQRQLATEDRAAIFYSDASQDELADQFGVSLSTIASIKRTGVCERRSAKTNSSNP